MHILRIEKSGECDIKDPQHNMSIKPYDIFCTNIHFFKPTCIVL